MGKAAVSSRSIPKSDPDRDGRGREPAFAGCPDQVRSVSPSSVTTGIFSLEGQVPINGVKAWGRPGNSAVKVNPHMNCLLSFWLRSAPPHDSNTKAVKLKRGKVGPDAYKVLRALVAKSSLGRYSALASTARAAPVRAALRKECRTPSFVQ